MTTIDEAMAAACKEIERLRSTLTWIVKQEPATQDYTLVSDICARARDALKKEST